MSAEGYSANKTVRTAEKAIVGCIMLLGNIPAELATLKPNDFYSTGIARVWKVIQEMHNQGIKIDYVSLHTCLEKNGIKVWPSTLTEFIEKSIPSYYMGRELTSIETNASAYKLMIQNAAFEREKVLLKQKAIRAISENDFLMAKKILEWIVRVGHD